MTEDHLPLRAFFGHHKSATTWITDILREISTAVRCTLAVVHGPTDFAGYDGLYHWVRHTEPELLAYTNADFSEVKELPRFRGFHVVRDPRDIVVSAYFSHRYSHYTDKWPDLEHQRERLERLSKDEGLISEMEFCEPTFTAMYEWDYSCDHILELKMEQLIERPGDTFVEAARFLGFIRRNSDEQSSLSPARVREITKELSFSRLSGGRRRGEEDVTSHYRKGVPGDWKNHFTPHHVATFKRRYNDLLLKLGYESDANWGGVERQNEQEVGR